ncbi:DUF3099 domain-containing protein [Knoellia subterranea]|uniref:DUF3099 domain-containing protein n=1 Tax=Knoellia subterranea KCTC 19937 TaxID=1385521 RepID=A0A0A0JSX0_9MICO|nr:DUF3099 domain-containing protein [Knoellia subterranea]KGN38736.1 hypothetical protein N803_08385 [Knoellia subterranea KCTC 19937]
MSTIRRGEPTVQSVTSARSRADDDINARMKHYLVTMGIRTACFFLAVVTQGWVRWTCVALAVVLPYIAVLFANARSPRAAGRLAPVTPQEPHREQLEK